MSRVEATRVERFEHIRGKLEKELLHAIRLSLQISATSALTLDQLAQVRELAQHLHDKSDDEAYIIIWNSERV